MSLHLAWCSPLPPAESGIADYSAELLPHLAERCAVTCYVDDPGAVSPAISSFVRVQPLAAVLEAKDELPVYHLGNHVGFHASILRMAMRRPGVLVLHEIVLHDLLQRVFLETGQANGFAAWVRAAEPLADSSRVRDIGQCRVAPHGAPLSEPLVRASRATVTLNAWARDELQRRCPGATVTAAMLYAADPPQHTGDVAAVRSRYRLPKDAFVIGSFGHQTPNKRLDVALRAFAAFVREHPNSVYLFAGPSSARIDVQAMAKSLGCEAAIRHFGYVSETMWWDLLLCTDLCVSLRGPTQGEASASTLKQMTAAKAICVSAAGPDLEFPEHVVVHIPQDQSEVTTLTEAMSRAEAEPGWRGALGEAARAYVHDVHSGGRAAGALITACADAAALPNPDFRFDLEAALHETTGVAAMTNRWLFRARLARAVSGRQGWGAVVRATQRRLAAGNS